MDNMTEDELQEWADEQAELFEYEQMVEREGAYDNV